MLVAICQIELHIPESQSLKEKRFVLSSLKAKIRQKFNVSIAEVDATDKWQRTVLGIAIVSNNRKHLDEIFSKILSLINRETRVEVIDHLFELV